MKRVTAQTPLICSSEISLCVKLENYTIYLTLDAEQYLNT